MPKPASHLAWTVGNVDFATVTQEPSGAKKQAGWLAKERPPREYMNWLFWNQDQWNKYFEEVTDAIAGFANIYSAFVGGPASLNPYPATAAGFQDAIDDSGVGDKILVLADIALTAQVQATRNNMGIEIHPRVTISKGGGGPVTGLRLSATGVRLSEGRFSGWSVGGDKAILVDPASDYCILKNVRFLNCDTEIDMQNTKSVSEGHITE